MLIDRTVEFIIKFGREVLDIAAANIKPGVTADEIDRIVHEVHSHFCRHIRFSNSQLLYDQACVERDCYPSPLNYFHFPKSCCT